MGADNELPLRGAEDLRLAVFRDGRHAGVWLEIALVHGFGAELALDHQIGPGEARLDIAVAELDTLGDVRRAVGLHAYGDHGLVEDRGARLQGLRDVGDVRQDLIVHLDQLQRLPRRSGTGGRDGRDGVSLIEDLLASHDVPAYVPIVQHHLACGGELWRQVAEVVPCHDSLHALERLGRGGVDAQDAGVGVRAAQDPSDQLAGELHVGAEAGAPGDLVHAVRADRAGADDLEVRIGLERCRHQCAPLISAAASWTARTILS
jgi:hypothetical protein